MDMARYQHGKSVMSLNDAINHDTDRTILQAFMKPELDPVEQFIYDNEMDDENGKWRKQLQAMLDYVSSSNDLNQVERNNQKGIK